MDYEIPMIVDQLYRYFVLSPTRDFGRTISKRTRSRATASGPSIKGSSWECS